MKLLSVSGRRRAERDTYGIGRVVCPLRGGDMWERETDYVDDGRKEKKFKTTAILIFFIYFFICLFLLLSLFCVLLARVKTDGAMGQWGNGRKNMKKWGFLQTPFIKKITYEYTKNVLVQ